MVLTSTVFGTLFYQMLTSIVTKSVQSCLQSDSLSALHNRNEFYINSKASTFRDHSKSDRELRAFEASILAETIRYCNQLCLSNLGA